jgi:hypothetical protein
MKSKVSTTTNLYKIFLHDTALNLPCPFVFPYRAGQPPIKHLRSPSTWRHAAASANIIYGLYDAVNSPDDIV